MADHQAKVSCIDVSEPHVPPRRPDKPKDRVREGGRRSGTDGQTGPSSTRETASTAAKFGKANFDTRQALGAQRSAAARKRYASARAGIRSVSQSVRQRQRAALQNALERRYRAAIMDPDGSKVKIITHQMDAEWHGIPDDVPRTCAPADPPRSIFAAAMPCLLCG